MPTPLRCLVSIVLLALAAAGALAGSAQLAAGSSSGGDTLALRAVPAAEAVAPGGQLPIAVEFTIQDTYHIWPPDAPISTPELPGWMSIPTTLTIVPEDLVAGPIQWPQPHPIATGALGTAQPIEIPMFEGRNVAYLPLLVPESAPPGERTIRLRFAYQACDDAVCLPPADVTVEVTLHIDPDAPAAAAGSPDLFAGFDPSIFADMAAGTATAAPQHAGDDPPPTRAFFGIAVPRGDGPLGLLVLALLGIVGGFILNLTPCVLPVIPIKIMTISQHAGSPGRSLALGLWMALGVVAFWVGIGLPVAFLARFTDPSLIFGLWWVTLAIGLIIAVMALGLFGLFQIQLPQRLYMVNPKADNPQGSFLFGVMTAILGLPCFGFVAGALLAGAAALPAATVVLIFTSIGLGMAVPYLVLSAKPQWVEKIPRTGPAGELVKQVMGLLLLAAAAFFIGTGIIALILRTAGPAPELPWWWKQTHWWAVALLVLAAALWLIFRTFRITSRPGPRASLAVVGLLLGGGVTAYAVDSTLSARHNFWIPFTAEAWQDAIADGRVVVLDFTAVWCINCHFLEETVLNRNPVRAELLSPGVLPLQADLSSNAAPGWQTLKELGQTGIPTLAVFGPGLETPWISNSYTPQMVLDAIARARSGADPIEQAAAAAVPTSGG